MLAAALLCLVFSIDEFLEMVGVTVIVWAACDFAVAQGLVLSFQPAATAEHGGGQTVGVENTAPSLHKPMTAPSNAAEPAV